MEYEQSNPASIGRSQCLIFNFLPSVQKEIDSASSTPLLTMERTSGIMTPTMEEPKRSIPSNPNSCFHNTEEHKLKRSCEEAELGARRYSSGHLPPDFSNSNPLSPLLLRLYLRSWWPPNKITLLGSGRHSSSSGEPERSAISVASTPWT
ncbi:hypothetical protein IFR05_000405 [Cadophora sp. M221]|nr:hypothetical protein IFR05_000405 [Cadophora sp. M221]